MKNVLVLCTGNSARSILGEALINHLGTPRFQAYSAGSHPKGEVHPSALDVMARSGLRVGGFSSKSWDAFAGSDAPPIDIVITVCDNAAGEVCPVFPGRQIRAHWGIADPASAETPEEIKTAFDKAYAEMKARVEAFCALDIGAMDAAELQQALNAIGTMEGATEGV